MDKEILKMRFNHLGQIGFRLSVFGLIVGLALIFGSVFSLFIIAVVAIVGPAAVLERVALHGRARLGSLEVEPGNRCALDGVVLDGEFATLEPDGVEVALTVRNRRVGAPERAVGHLQRRRVHVDEAVGGVVVLDVSDVRHIVLVVELVGAGRAA